MSKWQRRDVNDYSYTNNTDILEQESVYVFFGDGKAVYVGESIRPNRRFKEHTDQFWTELIKGRLVYHTQWGDFYKIEIAVRGAFKYGESAMAERRLIISLMPAGNKRHKKRPKQRKMQFRKTTDAEVLNCRAMFDEDGYTIQEIVKISRLSYGVVYNICKGNTHAEVGYEGEDYVGLV